MSGKVNCKEGRFIQVGNSLVLSKKFQELKSGARWLYLSMAMESGGKREVTFTHGSGKKYGIKPSSKGEEYFQTLFLHELVHIRGVGDHSRAFHEDLDSLIDRYIAATNSRIVNDYYGRQMRHDSRTYDPLKIAGSPPPLSVGSRAFRTEAL